MTKILLWGRYICLFSFSFVLFAMSPAAMVHAQVGWRWGVGTSGTGEASDDIIAAVNDKHANVITVGYASPGLDAPDTLTVDTQVFYFDTAGPLSGERTMITKADSSGNLLWSLQVYGTTQSFPVQAAVDTGGNIYVLGTVWGSLAQIGTYTINASSSQDRYFLVKISPTGAVIWADTICAHDSSGYVYGYGAATGPFSGGIAVDEGGNVYVSGTFWGSSVSIGSTTLTNADPTGRTNDLFVAKYNTSGVPVWAKGFGGSDQDGVNAMAMTGDGAIFLSSMSNSPSMSFGSITVSSPCTIASLNLNNVVAKMDTNGNVIWVKNLNCNIEVGAVAADAGDNFYIDGFVDSNVVFGTDTVVSYTNWGSYVLAKYDSAGNFLWVNSARYVKNNLAGVTSIAIDQCQNVWVSIPSQDTQVIGDSMYIAVSSARDPLTLAEFSSSGTLLQAVLLPSGGEDWSSVTVDGAGNLYAEGDYYGSTLQFGSDFLYPDVGEEVYIAKYKYDTVADPCPIALSCCTTPAAGNAINIYPNPASSTLTISSAQTITRIQIYSLPGQTVFAESYNSQIAEVNVASLPPGFYLIRVNDTQVSKFVKQ